MSHLSRQTAEAQLAGADPAAVPKVHELLAGPIEAILRDASLGKAARAAALQQVQCGRWEGTGIKQQVGKASQEAVPLSGGALTLLHGQTMVLLGSAARPQTVVQCDQHCSATHPALPRPFLPPRPKMPPLRASRRWAPSEPSLHACPAPAACPLLTWITPLARCCPPPCGGWRWRRAGAATGGGPLTCAPCTAM